MTYMDTFAEAIYGQPALSDGTFAGVNYGRTEDGYIILNTGNAVADSIASVLLNEIGVDNYVNAWEAFGDGNIGRGIAQGLFGVAQTTLALIPGVNVIRGATSGARAAAGAYRAARASGGITRALGRIPGRVGNRVRYTVQRAGQQPTIRGAIGSAVPRYGSTARQIRAARQPDPIFGLPPMTLWRQPRSGTIQWRGGAAFAPPPAVPLRPGQIRAQARQASRAALDPTATVPMWSQRARLAVGRAPLPGAPAAGFTSSRLGRTAITGTVGGLYGAEAVNLAAAPGTVRSERDRRAQEAYAARLGQQGRNYETTMTDIRARGADEEIQAALDAINESNTGVDSSGNPTPEVDIETSRQASLGSIDAQYNRAVSELRSMYNLSETDDEKDRIKFILADIQAQAEAGRQAIQNVFQRKSEEVGKLTEASREAAIKSAQRATDLYQISSAQLQDELEASFAAAAQDAYGMGAATPREQSEYVQLLSAMAPVTAEYRQAIGDINTQGLEWMSGVMGEQSAARQGDLQRLALSTSAAANAEHKAAVDRRVNAERLALADALQSLREQQMSQAGATQRALIGAQPSDTDMFDSVDIQGFMVDAVLQTGSPTRAIERYRAQFAGKPNPLGGVYPNTPPDWVLDAIREAKSEYDSAMAISQSERLLSEQELANQRAALGSSVGVP